MGPAFVFHIFQGPGGPMAKPNWLLVSEPGFLALAGTFETFRNEVEDWEEWKPNTETSK